MVTSQSGTFKLSIIANSQFVIVNRANFASAVTSNQLDNVNHIQLLEVTIDDRLPYFSKA